MSDPRLILTATTASHLGIQMFQAVRQASLTSIGHQASLTAMDVEKALREGDERELWEVWRTQAERSAWQDGIARLHRDGREEHLVRSAEQALAELPEVTALQALQANRRLVELLTGRRWIAMRSAREQGATWEQIGEALGMSRQAAHEWYGKKIEAQERYVGELHDADRARAALAEGKE